MKSNFLLILPGNCRNTLELRYLLKIPLLPPKFPLCIKFFNDSLNQRWCYQDLNDLIAMRYNTKDLIIYHITSDQVKDYLDFRKVFLELDFKEYISNLIKDSSLGSIPNLQSYKGIEPCLNL